MEETVQVYEITIIRREYHECAHEGVFAFYLHSVVLLINGFRNRGPRGDTGFLGYRRRSRRVGADYMDSIHA